MEQGHAKHVLQLYLDTAGKMELLSLMTDAKAKGKHGRRRRSSFLRCEDTSFAFAITVTADKSHFLQLLLRLASDALLRSGIAN